MNFECEKCKSNQQKSELTELFGWGIYFCTPCINQFLQPERSKREDFEELSEEFLSISTSSHGGNWETESGYILGIEEFSKWLNQRCGALNIAEMQ